MIASDPKPTRTPAPDDREARLDFKVAVLAVDGGCVVHDDPAECVGRLHAHHAISQQDLRKHGLFAYLWDPTNGATACEEAHRRHHNRAEPIPYERLPQRCVDFAARHGLDYVLDRYYPRSDDE